MACLYKASASWKRSCCSRMLPRADSTVEVEFQFWASATSRAFSSQAAARSNCARSYFGRVRDGFDANLGDRLHVAWIRPKRFANIEGFLESVVFGEKNNQGVLFQRRVRQVRVLFIELARPGQVYRFFRPIPPAVSASTGQIWPIGSGPNQFRGLVELVASPVEIHLKRESCDRVGLNLLEIVDDILHIRQRLFVARHCDFEGGFSPRNGAGIGACGLRSPGRGRSWFSH